jgi:hypothetical protein
MADAMIKAKCPIAQRRPGMLASVVTGQYCRVHQLLFISSLQEWLSFSPAHLAHAFSDAMQVVEAPCPRCLAMTDRPAKAISGAVCTALGPRNTCSRSVTGGLLGVCDVSYTTPSGAWEKASVESEKLP